MKKISLIFIILLVFVGCKAKHYDPSKPKPLLPVETMEDILKDIYLLEEELGILETKCRENNFSDDSAKNALCSYGNKKYDQIMQKHETNRKTWIKNYRYYMENKTLADTLMNRVIDNLVQMDVERTKKIKSSETKFRDVVMEAQ